MGREHGVDEWLPGGIALRTRAAAEAEPVHRGSVDLNEVDFDGLLALGLSVGQAARFISQASGEAACGPSRTSMASTGSHPASVTSCAGVGGSKGKTVEIRAAGEAEAAKVIRLYEWLFAPPGAKPGAWDERRAEVALRQAIESHDSAVIVADDGGDFVGFITAYQDMHSVRFGYRAWVEDLAVDPERRSEGIGKALLDAAKAWAKERGATHLELDSSDARPDAHRFYEREGPTWTSRCFGWEL